LRAEARPADVERGGCAPNRGGPAQVADQNNPFAALATNADAALEDGADGDALGVLENLGRDGVVGALALFQDLGGVMDALVHVGGAGERGGGEEEGD